MLTRLPWFPKFQSSQASVVCAGQTSQIHGDPTWQLTELKRCVANILVPDTTGHLRGSSGVRASTGHGCFHSKRGPTHYQAGDHNVTLDCILPFNLKSMLIGSTTGNETTLYWEY